MIQRFFSLCLVLGIFYSCIQRNEYPDKKESSINPDYLDPYRPQIHYSRDTGWMSDPNGLYFLDGEWHLMFQGFCNREKWNGTNWDHAVSKDLLHWEHMPTVFDGNNLISYYSGSVYVDTSNVSGLGNNKQIPVLAFYTTHPMDGHPARPNHNMISIGYSLDNGSTWHYGDMDIIDNPANPGERDPSVFWHKPSEKFIMADIGKHCIRFYSSDNLLEWNFESEALQGTNWECPDLNFMSVKETGEKKVVLITSINQKHGAPNSSHGTAYHIGTFDGHKFSPEDATDNIKWMDWGSDFYAGITYSNAPDNRVLLQSWFGWPAQFYNTMAPTSRFTGSMNLIRELTLHKDEAGNYFLKSNPIEEYKKLRTDSVVLKDFSIEGSKDVRKNMGSHEPVEIVLEAKLDEGSTMGIRLKNDFGEDYVFRYDDWHRQFVGDRTKTGAHPRYLNKNYNDFSDMPYKLKDQQLKLHIFWDVSTFEVFVDDGKEAFSQLLYPREPFTTIELFAFNGRAKVNSFKIYDLKSIWSKE